MSDIVLSVDYSDLAAAKREMDDLRKTLGQAQQAAKIAAGAFDSAFLDAAQAISKLNKEQNLIAQNQKSINAVLGLDKSLKSAADSARAFSAAFKFQEQKAETAFALGAQKAKELALAQEEATRSAARLAAEKDKLRQKYDSLYSASVFYERSLEEIKRAHEIGAISAKKQQQAVDALNAEYEQFQTGTANFSNRFVQHTNQASRGLNKFGFYAQQVGYQVGDFFVQVQSGTNVLVAFGQQATQLAGLIPGVWGAAIGIGISLATALGAAWMRTKDSMDSAKGSALSLAEAQKELNQASGDFTSKMDMLRFGVDTEAEAVALRSILELTTKIRRLNEQYQSTDSLSRRQALAEEAQALKKQLSAQQAIVDEVNTKRAAYEKAMAINNQMMALQLGHARAIGQSLEERKQTLVESYGLYARTRAEASQTAEQVDLIESGMSQAAVDALRFAGVDLASGVSAAAREAAVLAGNMQISLTAALNLINLQGSKTYSGRGGDPRAFMDGGSKSYSSGFHPFNASVEIPKVSGGSSGGGGGGTQVDVIGDLEREIAKKQQLLGLNQQQIALQEELWRIQDALGADASKYSEAKLSAIAKENLAIQAQLDLQREQQQAMENLTNNIAGSVGDAFMSIVDGTSSVKDAFRKMAADIIKQLYQVLVVQRLVGTWDRTTGFGSGLAGFLGKLISFDGGGYTGSGSRSGGLDGKGGFLAMIHPDETVIDHTKRKQSSASARPLSVGNSQAPVTVHQHFNISANGDDSVRRIVKEEAPKLAQQAKAAVLDAKRRGGAYGKAF